MAFYQLTAKKIKTSISNALDSFTLTIYFGQGAHVEGHNGLMSYSPQEIVFKKKKGLVKLVGEKLSLTEISKTDAYVKGRIITVASEGDTNE